LFSVPVAYAVLMKSVIATLYRRGILSGFESSVRTNCVSKYTQSVYCEKEKKCCATGEGWPLSVHSEISGHLRTFVNFCPRQPRKGFAVRRRHEEGRKILWCREENGLLGGTASKEDSYSYS